MSFPIFIFHAESFQDSARSRDFVCTRQLEFCFKLQLPDSGDFFGENLRFHFKGEKNVFLGFVAIKKSLRV